MFKPVRTEASVRSPVPVALRRELPRVELLQGVRRVGLGSDGAGGGHAGVYHVRRHVIARVGSPTCFGGAKPARHEFHLIERFR